MKKMILVFTVMIGLACQAQSDKYVAAMQKNIPLFFCMAATYLSDWAWQARPNRTNM